MQQPEPQHSIATSPIQEPIIGAGTMATAAMSRAQPAPGMSPPVANRPGTGVASSTIMQSSPPPMHPQHPSSVPPPRQMQSPGGAQRSTSAQNTPVIPPNAQQSPRTTTQPNAANTPSMIYNSNQPRGSVSAAGSPVAASNVLPPQSAGAVAIRPPVSSSTQSQPNPATVPSTTAVASALSQQQPVDAGARPLNVSDALSYLDLVKSQFHDRPEVYNQFLEIMKEFKSHSIDTPGVIDRVSQLFYGSPSLIQGFNTFLPPGYRIECSDDPNGGVRVTTPSGSIIPDMHRRSSVSAATNANAVTAQSPVPGSRGALQQYGQQQQQQQQTPRRNQTNGQTQQTMRSPQQQTSTGYQATPASSSMAMAGTSIYQTPQGGGQAMMATSTTMTPNAMGSPTMGGDSSGNQQRSRQAPMEFNHAINYVNKIKMRFATEPDRYKEFLEILQTYQKESRPIQDVYAQVRVLFAAAPDLLDEFKQFLPDTSESAANNNIASMGSPSMYHRTNSAGMMHSQKGGTAAVDGGRLPPVGDFTPVGASSGDPFVSDNMAATAAAAMAQTPTSGRKRKGMLSGSNAQGPGLAKRRNKVIKADFSGVTTGDMVDYVVTSGQATGASALLHQPSNPATATPDELAFFERVKRFIGQPAAYNEFLKLLNLYNQQVLDPKTLVERCESFIGDDQELFGWFKQFVGYDERQSAIGDNRYGDEGVMESVLGPEPVPYISPEDIAKSLRPARPKVNLAQCKSYGPSYRLLPDASTQSKCSGRDAMCYEVLNDKWASHPTWASEDTEFVHHKKNQFEEAMFRSEEDRHEMDIEIDTNLSVIRQLTPIAHQIENMDPEKQMQLTLPENFWGMSEALPRRALRRVYDQSRALEIIKAMHSHPAVAIPIVLKRLKQKDEEWRRQRREYARVWRETDAKNYYRALDHQGLTFKSADRKSISPKQLITEIETRRREQQKLADEGGARCQNRKVASALRHRYQLEYHLDESSVIADVVNAILAHVGKPNSQFSSGEKEAMEKFFHELFGELFGVEDSNASTAASQMNGINGINDVVTEGEKNSIEADSPNEVDDNEDKEKQPSPAVKGNKEEETAAQSDEKAKEKTPVAENSSNTSTPGLISSRSWIQLGSSGNREPSVAPSTASGNKSMSRAFYTNSNYYVFLRLFQILYKRFSLLRELGPECQQKAMQTQQKDAVATKLGMRGESDVLKDYDLETTDYYTIFLELVDQFLQGQLETNSFDEAIRVMYGIHAYKILTVDKVVQAASKNIQNLISDSRCIDILELFTSLPPVHEQSPLRSHIASRLKVEALVGADEHVFRVDYIYESKTMTIQLLRHEDITLDEAVTEEERWAYYVDSYVLFEPTEGVPRLQERRPRPYLRRHLQADECDYAISSRSNLEIKIAVNTYKLCFLTGTEDIYANHTRRMALTKPEAITAYEEQWKERTGTWHEWVAEQLEQQQQQPKGEEGETTKVEWWK